MASVNFRVEFNVWPHICVYTYMYKLNIYDSFSLSCTILILDYKLHELMIDQKLLLVVL